MKSLLTVIAVLFSLSAIAQDPNPIRVTGVGATTESAMQAGFRSAIEVYSGSVILSDKEVKNNKITQNEIASYSAGYVDKYEILKTHSARKEIVLVMDVWIRPSKMAEHKLLAGKDVKDIDGERIGTQIQSYTEERNSADKFINKILNDFPKHALELKQGKTEVTVDSYRNISISFNAQIKWNQRYLDSLKEALDVVQDGPEYYSLSCMCYVAREQIAIKKLNPGDYYYTTSTFYLRDRVLATQVYNRLSIPPKINATLYNDDNKEIYTQCFLTQEAFTHSNKFKNLFSVHGNTFENTTVHLTVAPNSEMANLVKKSSKIELSLTTTCK